MTYKEKYQLNNSSLYNTPIYYTDLGLSEKKFKYAVKSILSGQCKYDYEHGISDSLPLFIKTNYITIPKGLKRYLERNKKLLKLIDTDSTIAIEKCLLLASNLSNQEEPKEWKRLCSKILQIQVKKSSDNTYLVKHVIDVLLQSGYIEVKKNNLGYHDYKEGEKCRDFRLATNSFEFYELVSPEVINNRKQAILAHLRKVADNSIVRNLLKLYPNLTFPEKKVLEAKAKQLVKKKYTNRKGQLLRFRNKHADSYFKDIENTVFVEDHLELFDRYVTMHLRIPSIGDDKSGGRVVDSLVLLPKWIREEILIDGERIVECDYQCLHPNIAFSIYGGGFKYLTHQIVADYLGIDVKMVKRGHLKFFNQRLKSMIKNPVFRYYIENHEGLLKSFGGEKIKNNTHKITSKRLFAKEVKLMTKVIKKLNGTSIYGIYVYDALYVKESDSIMVTDVMNAVAKEMGIYTIV